MEREETMLRRIDQTLFTYAVPGPQRQNSLIVDTIELFAPRYSTHSFILHLKDPANNITIHEKAYLAELGIMPPIGKPRTHFPDIILYRKEKHLLFFIAVTPTRGVITEQWREDLEAYCTHSSTNRVYLSSFFDRDDYRQWMPYLAWRSYAWMAHQPDHIIVHW